MTEVVLDPATGELIEGHEHEDGCHRCAAYRELAERLKVDLEGEQKHTLALRRRIKALEDELKEVRLEKPEAQTVRTLFSFWVRETARNPKRTKLGEKREKAVLARLHDGYSPEYIMHAIRGAAAAANSSDRETERLALIRVMREAVEMVSPEQAKKLRDTFREAMGRVQRYDDLELICRNEVNLERFFEKACRVIGPMPEPPEKRGDG